MKNKKLVIKLLFASLAFFVLVVLIEFLFKYFRILDVDKSTFGDITIRALLSSILWFFILYFWLRRKMKKQSQ